MPSASRTVARGAGDAHLLARFDNEVELVGKFEPVQFVNKVLGGNADVDEGTQVHIAGYPGEALVEQRPLGHGSTSVMWIAIRQASSRWVGPHTLSMAMPWVQAFAQGSPLHVRQAEALVSSSAYSSRAMAVSP